MTEEPTSAASPVVAHEVAHGFAGRYVLVRTLVRLLLLVVALFVALALVLVRARGHSQHGGLAPSRGGGSIEFQDRYIGLHVWYGRELEAQGDRPVTLESADLVSVDPGLDVRGVWAVDSSPCLSWPATVGGDAGALRRQYPSAVLHRVKGVVVRPDQPNRWCLLAEVVATGLGTHRVEGVRVRWKGGSIVYRDVLVLDITHSRCEETFLANHGECGG